MAKFQTCNRIQKFIDQCAFERRGESLGYFDLTRPIRPETARNSIFGRESTDRHRTWYFNRIAKPTPDYAALREAISFVVHKESVTKKTFWIIKKSSQSATQLQKFELLADQWERETRNVSSPKIIVAHPALGQIADMGAEVVPFILRRMEHRPWFWFGTLLRLTKQLVDPITPDMRGDMQMMTDAWVLWGKQRGRI